MGNLDGFFRLLWRERLGSEANKADSFARPRLRFVAGTVDMRRKTSPVVNLGLSAAINGVGYLIKGVETT
jgi:hypothetical protein